MDEGMNPSLTASETLYFPSFLELPSSQSQKISAFTIICGASMTFAVVQMLSHV